MRTTVALRLLLCLAVVESFRLLGGPAGPQVRRHGATVATGATVDLPMEPTAGLGPTDVCRVVCEGLQKNDEPAPDSGIIRLYNWMTGPGRVSLAPPPPRSGLQGKVTLEYFVAEAAGPAIGALMECATPPLASLHACA